MRSLPIPFLLASLLLLGCSEPEIAVSTQPDDTVQLADPAHNSRNALDWDGRYEGMLPCADCEGIKTRLTLQQDGQFTLETQYLGKSDDWFHEQGAFQWDSSGQIVQLERERSGPAQFFVGENVLWQLDMSGQRIQGELADRYRLVKVPPAELAQAPLAGTRWQLVELMGQAVPADSPAYIVFSGTEPKVYGNAGCNRFFGSYALVSEQQRLSLSGIGMTMMACPESPIEPGFAEVLQRFDNFNLSDDSLTLNRARMAPLARLTAAGPADE